VNAAAGDLCRSYNQLTNLKPFSESAKRDASVEDVDRVFRPDGGAMWQLYNTYLKDSLDCGNGGCRIKLNPKTPLQPPFIDFFSKLYRLSRLLYRGQDPIIRLQLTVQPFNRVKKLDFTVDGNHIPISAGSASELSWDIRSSQSLKITGDFEGASGETLFELQGRWALFGWLYGDSLPESRKSGVFDWIPRFGQKTPQTLPNGHTKEYKIEVKSGDGRLDLSSLQLGPCRLPVAR
jgi:type VI protein secretion system component VasK